MSQLIVGLIAFVLSIVPSKVAEAEKQAKYKIGLPILVGIVAITGYIVSETNAAKLNNQLQTMFHQVTIEATRSDIDKLVDHIDLGFKSVTEAIAQLRKGQKIAPPVKPPVTQPALSAPPNVTVTQARTVSTNPQFKFGLQITIQSDQTIPASFAIECTGEVGKVDAFVVGHGAMLEVAFGALNPTTAFVHIGYPQIAPQSPLVITILSKDDIRAKTIRPY